MNSCKRKEQRARMLLKLSPCPVCGGRLGDPRSVVCAKCKKGIHNPMWKGDAVGYTALHAWVRRNLPKPAVCTKCNNSAYDLANKSGEYRRDIEDWEWLCRACHMKSDGRLKAFIEHASKRCRTARDAWKCSICKQPADYSLAHVFFCTKHWNYGAPDTPGVLYRKKLSLRDLQIVRDSAHVQADVLAKTHNITKGRVYQILRQAAGENT